MKRVFQVTIDLDKIPENGRYDLVAIALHDVAVKIAIKQSLTAQTLHKWGVGVYCRAGEVNLPDFDLEGLVERTVLLRADCVRERGSRQLGLVVRSEPTYFADTDIVRVWVRREDGEDYMYFHHETDANKSELVLEVRGHLAYNEGGK